MIYDWLCVVLTKLWRAGECKAITNDCEIDKSYLCEIRDRHKKKVTTKMLYTVHFNHI